MKEEGKKRIYTSITIGGVHTACRYEPFPLNNEWSLGNVNEVHSVIASFNFTPFDKVRVYQNHFINH